MWLQVNYNKKPNSTNQISTDKDVTGQGLDRAVVWGAKYKFNDQLNSSYYGLDVQDKTRTSLCQCKLYPKLKRQEYLNT